jgi:YebC/PmpR family DNA-binding regulatory protein
MGRGPSIAGRKNAEDARRGKIFTKVIREISVAARISGDPNANPRLRAAIDKGLSANMPKDTIERAIKKATGELAGVEYEEIRYEGYAPGGVAVIVDTMTDNRNRTVAEIRNAFSRGGGSLGTDGSVAFLFRKLGVLSFAAGADEDRITELAIDAGADDVVVYPHDGSIDVLTAPDAFQAVKDAMIAAGLQPEHAEVALRADNSIAVAGDVAKSVVKLLDMLEDFDDVQTVSHNAELSADAYD